MHKIIWIAAVSLLALSTPATAAPRLMIDHPSWKMFQTTNGSGCFILQEYPTGEVFIVGYNARDNYSSISVSNPQWSLRPGTSLSVLLVTSDSEQYTVNAEVVAANQISIEAEGTAVMDLIQGTSSLILAWDDQVRAGLKFADMSDGVSTLRSICAG